MASRIHSEYLYGRGCAISLQPVIKTDTDRSDEDLVKDTRSGSDQAFELLMRRHSGTIRNLIARFHPDRSLVDDLAQETFVKAYFKMNSYRGDSPFIFWLKKIAVRLCLDHSRHAKVTDAESIKNSQAVEADIQKTETGSNQDTGKQIEARLLLGKILAKLQPADRIILVLFYGEGYDSNEISQLTGLSRTNVKVRAFRIRRHLRKIYAGGLE